MKNILVTGSNGLLGSAIIRYLKSNPNEYQFVAHSHKDCDLSIRDKAVSYIYQKSEQGVDTIIHCAAEVGGVLKNTLHPQEMFENNLAINNNVFEAASSAKIENFVNILSACVFPNNANYPLTPDQIYNGDPHPSAFGYSLAKRLSFQTVQSYHKVFKNNWINVVPTNIYGINDNFHRENSHVMAALIRKAHEAKETGGDFIIWGRGENYRQFIFSDDLAKLIVWSIDNWKSEKIFMAVNPQEYTIKELSLIVANKFGIEPDRIKHDLSKPEGITRMTASSNAGWFEFTPLEKGLDITINWYQENYNNIRK